MTASTSNPIKSNSHRRSGNLISWWVLYRSMESYEWQFPLKSPQLSKSVMPPSRFRHAAPLSVPGQLVLCSCLHPSTLATETVQTSRFPLLQPSPPNSLTRKGRHVLVTARMPTQTDVLRTRDWGAWQSGAPRLPGKEHDFELLEKNNMVPAVE